MQVVVAKPKRGPDLGVECYSAERVCETHDPCILCTRVFDQSEFSDLKISGRRKTVRLVKRAVFLSLFDADSVCVPLFLFSVRRERMRINANQAVG